MASQPQSRTFFTPDMLSQLTQKDRDEAMARAKRTLADEWAKSELGLVDTKMPAIKGPIPIPDEEMFTITLDLGPTTDRIVIDGKPYMHAGTYTVTKRVYDTLSEIISRTWGHEREIEGKDSNAYRKQQNINAITGASMAVSPAIEKRLGALGRE